MNPASAFPIHDLRPKILARRVRLEAAARSVSADYITGLLAEVDAALARIDNGSYGLCETCHDPIEADRLENNPLARFCLDHLTREERQAHEQDIALATEIQSRLLPAADIATDCWATHYRYEPAGAVGGDYCEVIPAADGRTLFFAVGDVAGKGVAASLLMTHLSAIFRSLVPLDLPLTELIARANRLFCESTPSTHYATLAAGRATERGLDLCNAGHCRPLVLRKGGAERIEATGLPLGLFAYGRYEARNLWLDPGDGLVLYSDGITEAQDPHGNAFEEDGLIRCLHDHATRPSALAAEAVLREVARFRAAGPQQDDMTLLVVRRQL
jgi:sigma-B regulation protein RsbU (phosphoserine phosphatase)